MDPATEAAYKLGSLTPIYRDRTAISLLDDLSEGPEESHLEADEILVRFLKGQGFDDLARAWLQCRYRNSFWYA